MSDRQETRPPHYAGRYDPPKVAPFRQRLERLAGPLVVWAIAIVGTIVVSIVVDFFRRAC